MAKLTLSRLGVLAPLEVPGKEMGRRDLIPPSLGLPAVLPALLPASLPALLPCLLPRSAPVLCASFLRRSSSSSSGESGMARSLPTETVAVEVLV